MAVYKRSYRGYTGDLTPEWSRFLVITRHAWRSLFASRPMTGFFVACFFPFLITAIMIYLSHNATLLSVFKMRGKLIDIDANFFGNFLHTQVVFSFLLAAFAGPGLISPDLANNGLVLYFCRPFSRTEYVLGKFAVLAVLLSAITWVPGLLLFGMEGSLSGFRWMWDNLYVAGAILTGSFLLIAVVTLLALALSAWVKWKPVAGALVLGVMFIGAGFGAAVNGVMRTEMGDLFSIPALLKTACDALFRLPPRVEFPPNLAWLGLAAIGAACLYLLSRKLRAYEVVR